MTSNGYRVLLVEDEDLVALLTEQMLEDLGYELANSVASIGAGLEAAVQDRFDLAVLDVNLRGTPSFPIADRLIERGIPFIFASGYTADGIDARFADVPKLQKPFSMEALAKTLSAALTRPANSN